MFYKYFVSSRIKYGLWYADGSINSMRTLLHRSVDNVRTDAHIEFGLILAFPSHDRRTVDISQCKNISKSIDSVVFSLYILPSRFKRTFYDINVPICILINTYLFYMIHVVDVRKRSYINEVKLYVCISACTDCPHYFAWYISDC